MKKKKTYNTKSDLTDNNNIGAVPENIFNTT
jgi:hypothetical protein